MKKIEALVKWIYSHRWINDHDIEIFAGLFVVALIVWALIQVLEVLGAK